MYRKLAFPTTRDLIHPCSLSPSKTSPLSLSFPPRKLHSLSTVSFLAHSSPLYYSIGFSKSVESRSRNSPSKTLSRNVRTLFLLSLRIYPSLLRNFLNFPPVPLAAYRRLLLGPCLSLLYCTYPLFLLQHTNLPPEKLPLSSSNREGYANLEAGKKRFSIGCTTSGSFGLSLCNLQYSSEATRERIVL